MTLSESEYKIILHTLSELISNNTETFREIRLHKAFFFQSSKKTIHFQGVIIR